jgi:TPR repeat protein
MRETDSVPIQERSIVLGASREIAAREIGQSLALGRMVAGSLALARQAALKSDDPDVVVQQALRIQDGAPVMAFRLFECAAIAGHAEAQFHLFRCYWTANGVEQDRGKSLVWLHKSAELGFAPAQNELGCHCLLAAKLSEAVEWFRVSSGLGDSYGEWS